MSDPARAILIEALDRSFCIPGNDQRLKQNRPVTQKETAAPENAPQL
jgi:hypothetical protein